MVLWNWRRQQGGGRDNGLSRQVAEIGNAVTSMGNVLAAQQYSQLQVQQQQQAAAAAQAAEDKRKKENEELTANVLAAANAQAESQSKLFADSLKTLAGVLQDVQQLVSSSASSSNQTWVNSNLMLGSKRQAPPVATPRGKAKAWVQPPAT